MAKAAIKLRFCPSPTGLMHLGNARTALFNALFATHHQGSFLLRIEDTDQERSDEKYTQALMEDLRWLGLDWQEGPEAEGENGPYWQSQRQGIYDRYYEVLLEKELAYPCFCSEQQLAITRKVQLAAGQPPRYPGTCRHLTPEQLQAKLEQGVKPTLRFRVDFTKVVEFHDLVKGRQRFHTADMGDLVIRRGDGSAPFMFCNAIDDSLMGVTHVIRGEDHLTNTPRQLLILQALELPIPEYGHISLITALDGSKLSKRTGSKSIQELREQGFLPSAVTNYLARLGHYYESNDSMSLKQLSEQFSSANLAKAPAKFDPRQLIYWQKEGVLKLSLEELGQWLQPVIAGKLEMTEIEPFLRTIQPNVVFPEDASHWVTILFAEHLEYAEDCLGVLQEAGATFFVAAREFIAAQGTDYQGLCEYLKHLLGVKGKGLFQPLRIALTNQLHGPEIGPLLDLIGSKRAQQRFRDAEQFVTQ